ncbi:phosphate acetyltransferase [Helicobacter felis]|uniref:phosphate acetyltransferase n=1 Tax=Helicobacter felis TaxID=214 RepID=UPI000CF133B4|nr:phosphate acetyltransferase [Helicobacter felis]
MGQGILLIASAHLEEQLIKSLEIVLGAQKQSFKVVDANLGIALEDLVAKSEQNTFLTLLNAYQALDYEFVLLKGSVLAPLQALDPLFLHKYAQHLNLPVINALEGDAKACMRVHASFEHAGVANPITFAHASQNNLNYMIVDLQTSSDLKGPQLDSIYQVLNNTKSACLSPLRFQASLLKRAKNALKTIVLPESHDPRILQAAHIILQNQAAKLILLGKSEQVLENAQSLGLNLEGCQIIDPSTSEHLEDFANTLYALRQSKGLSLEEAHKLVKTSTYFATMLVYSGHADGMVSGATHTTADTVRPALQTIKLHPGVSLVSSVFFMCLDTQVLVFADCAINPNPTSEELAHIALSSARTAKSFGIEPRIAMLSYSTGTSGKGADVDKVTQAVEIARNLDETLVVDGPLQFDAAIDPATGAKKMPGSVVAGHANVFIFPDLDAGNIAYKAVQRTAKTLAIGPVLQGLKKPVNDLSRGCLVEDVVNTIIITAIQAQG